MKNFTKLVKTLKAGNTVNLKTCGIYNNIQLYSYFQGDNEIVVINSDRHYNEKIAMSDLKDFIKFSCDVYESEAVIFEAA